MRSSSSKRAALAADPGRTLLRAEFYSMPPEQNAAILARLCNDLLEVATIREEIDRWGWGRRGAAALKVGAGGEALGSGRVHVRSQLWAGLGWAGLR